MWRWLCVLLVIPSHVSYRVLKDQDALSLDFIEYFANTSSSEDTKRRLTAEDHLIRRLPGLDPTTPITHYAGHIKVDERFNGNIFYWLFESPQDAEEKPLMIWLNGGPGCSSMDGLWLELGPLRLKGEEVVINPYSWHNVANLLFIDQPVGTGLSYVDKKDGLCKNDECISHHFYSFLLKFFEQHDRYVKTEMVDGVAKRRITRSVTKHTIKAENRNIQ